MHKNENMGAGEQRSLRSLRDVVWLEPEPVPERDVGSGLYLPPRSEGAGDDGKLPPIVARVVAVGPGRRLRTGGVVPVGVRAGDRVIVGAYEGAAIVWQGQKLLAVREAAVHGVVEEDK